MKQLLLILLALSTVGASAQNVNIPDANFKGYLVGNTAINTNGDGEISTAEAAAFTGEIDCNNRNISNLEGIEAFTAIIQLICYNNNLMSLNLGSNTALTYLDCDFNNLENLDVSSNSTLTTISCNNNDLTSLDLSQNLALINLYCRRNQIGSLDLSQNTALTEVACSNNQLTSLNVANGNNVIIGGGEFDATGNPSLICIQVDDVAWSNANWPSKDATASYSTNCSLGIDDYGSEVLVSINPNPATSQITISSTLDITAIALIDITGKEVARPDTTNNSINVSYLSKGLYFLQIETTGGRVVEKFVKR